MHDGVLLTIILEKRTLISWLINPLRSVRM
ncbi:MAG: hypothetical protein K0Q60_2693 [Microvirga sp.]|jgi:hypothetical protein|nr:hypothetical protein [Microvirga sp.]